MIIGPKYKICKRLGASVFEKCQTQKFQLAEARAPRQIPRHRAGFVKPRRAARQMVGHGHVLINGRRVNVPSFKVEKGMTVSIRPESRDSALFVNRTDVMAETKAPAWLKFEDQGFSVQV